MEIAKSLEDHMIHPCDGGKGNLRSLYIKMAKDILPSFKSHDAYVLLENAIKACYYL